jgi:tetratricopeptide (TPR) repeat protein
VSNRQIRDLSDLGSVLTPASDSAVAGRPLINLSLAINYALGGVNVRGYHLWNIGTHLSCALLLMGLVRRTLTLPRLRGRFGRTAGGLAFAVALVWAVHPLNSEAVDYVIQRTESMMALFYLLTLYSSVRAVTETPSFRWSLLSVVSCAAGMACKESMATAPLMVVVFDRLLVFDSFKRAFSARWHFYAALCSTWIVAFALNASGPRANVVGLSSGISPWTYLLNQALIIPHYLRLAIWPRGLVVFYGWPESVTLSDVLPFAMVIVILLILTLVLLFRQSPLALLGIWFFVTLGPSSSVVPIATEVGAERRMYLPMMAVVAAAIIGVSWLSRWGVRDVRRPGPIGPGGAGGSIGPALLAVVSVALAAATIQRNREYASTVTLARTTVERRPTAVARHILGAELLAAGRTDEAVTELRKAVPGNSRARFDLGLALYNQGKHDEAVEQLQAYVATSGQRLVPRWLEPPANELVSARIAMIRVFGAQKRWPDVKSQAEAVLRIDPSNAEARRFLGGAFTNEGIQFIAAEKIDEAVASFRRAAEIEPDSMIALRNLANALVDRGDGAEAESAARRAVALAPNEPGVYDVLGRALAIQGKREEAAAQFERALAIDPGYADAREALRAIQGR